MKKQIVLGGMFALMLGLTGAARGQVIAPFYAADYSFVDLGSVPGVPANYGGLTVKYDDPNTLIIGGAANGPSGALYSVGLVRDMDGHVTGFSGSASYFADATFNDGGVVYGPGNVLFLAKWPVNQLGQTKPGSTLTDKAIDTAALGVEGSLSALNFVPAGYPGAGRLKMVTYSGGEWNDATVTPDGMGTYDLVGVTEVPASRLGGAPEGFDFVPLGSPQFTNASIILAEYGAGKIATYEMDGNGDPIVATRHDFITGLSGAEGAFIDPVTGDFLFSTFGGGSRVIAVRGFVPEPATAGLVGLAMIAARRRRAAR